LASIGSQFRLAWKSNVFPVGGVDESPASAASRAPPGVGHGRRRD
jgi:hypothetical protein